jgi:ubiquinone/menaquinone biosynthesis C-methylase UbiE
MDNLYVHGYDVSESIRLQDQASTLVELLHSDTVFPAGSKILEAGCGVGAQTITLAKNNASCTITSIDISDVSIIQAKKKIIDEGISNVVFQQGDIFNLSFEDESFDHVFVCFVLEHLKNPVEALYNLKKVLKPGGTITVIEGDHGSAYFYPDSYEAQEAINCQIKLQRQSGGNANIGRELYPLLKKSGFKDVFVSPRMVYVDSSKPQFVDGFIKKTFTAMIEGIKDSVVTNGLMDASEFKKGIDALYRTAEDDGVFSYTFFKATAMRL